MINEVRNTVLAIANKNNYGYISPQDFNLYCEQAQLDIFENYFYQYNSWLIKENQRVSGTGYADIVKGLEEVIDSFSAQVFLDQTVANLNNASLYELPADYIGYSFHSYETLPLKNNNLNPAEILKFRDDAWLKYHSYPPFLNLVEKKSGINARNDILKMTKIKLKRRILGD